MTTECVNASTCPPGTEHPHPVEDDRAEAQKTLDDYNAATESDLKMEPEPVLSGKFAIYEDKEGDGYHVYYEMTHNNERIHTHISAKKIAAAKKLTKVPGIASLVRSFGIG